MKSLHAARDKMVRFGRQHFFLGGALGLVAMLLVAGAARAALSLSVTPADGHAGAARTTQVQVAVVTPHDFTDNIEAIGQAKSREAVSISSNTQEIVSRVLMKDGMFVEKGDELLELKAREQQADTAQAQAALQVAALNYTRYKTLYDKGFLAAAALDQYRAAFDQAKAGVAAASSRQQDRIIRAPFAGRIGITDIAPGALINPGSVIATLDDVATMRVDFDVPDRFLPALKVGAPLTAQPDPYPGKTVQGRLQMVDSRIDPNTHAIRARAEFANPNNLLVPGMLMHVAVQSGARTAPALPESAVQSDSDQSYVYVVAKDQGARLKAVRTPVTVGADQGGFVEIANGLPEGAQVVADGLSRITPNAPLRIIQTHAGQVQKGRANTRKGHPGKSG